MLGILSRIAFILAEHLFELDHYNVFHPRWCVNILEATSLLFVCPEYNRWAGLGFSDRALERKFMPEDDDRDPDFYCRNEARMRW
jgi:hypothetical protein